LTWRASGPSVSNVGLTGSAPVPGIRPTVGRRPATPLKDAGRRMEPAVSLPIEPTHIPAATEAPEPPLEPPAMWPVFQGLRTGPKCRLWLVGPNTHSCRLAFPTITAPLRRSRSTTVAWDFAMLSRSRPEAPV